MNFLRSIWNRLLASGRSQTARREIDEELRFHIEQRTAENIAAGMPSQDAAREARKRFGNLQSAREQCRDLRVAGFLETTLQDVRFGLRMLYKSPGFTAIAILTLALGIGANTAIFSVINSVLLRPLAYHDPGKLVSVTQSYLKRGYAQMNVTPETLRLWKEQNTCFDELGAQMFQTRTLTGIDHPDHLDAAYTTPNFFTIFGVPPILGRTFVADDGPTGDVRVVVLSHGLWQRDFGGDRSVIGRSVTLGGLNYTVVGVMPPDFKTFIPPAVFGPPTGDVQPQVWMPYPQPLSERTNHWFLAVGRLKAGIQPARAQAELTTILGRLAAEYPQVADWRANVLPLKEEIIGGARPALRLLWVAVGFVLLIACANVANLSLARAASRGSEFAIRAALGAGRARLIRQLLAESAILAIVGGSLGSLLAWGSLAALRAFQPAKFPRLDEIQIDASVLVFTLLISVLTAVVFGLLPAMRASTPDLNPSLKDGRGSSEGHDRRRARGLLVVAEVALAMVLLAGAGLMISSFARLARVNPGFAPDQLMTFDFTPSGKDYNDDSKRLRLHELLRDTLQAQPGVKSAAVAWGIPFGAMLNSLSGVVVEDRPAPDAKQQKASGAWRVVGPNYFQTMAIPILAGRPFSEKLDKPNSPAVVIVNQAFAREVFGSENPVGKRIQLFNISTNWCQIVGVAQDVRLTGLDAPTVPEVYQPDPQQPAWRFSLVVRSSLPTRQVESLVSAASAGFDKDLVPYNVKTMDSAISSSVSSRRFTTILTGLFAGLALALTVVGIYGVISYAVSRQTREIGVRMALGATRGSVLALVLRRGMILALAGVAVGLAGSLVLTRLIASQLFETKPDDPVIFVAVTTMLILVTLAACYLPARRATRIEPMEALRYE